MKKVSGIDTEQKRRKYSLLIAPLIENSTKHN